MQQNCQDTLSVVTHKGKPDLFITITMNPKCREVMENLLSGQTPNDRPDLVARVFKQKLNELINDIKKNHIFGVPVAWVYVVEFQKRGLPHAHILVTIRYFLRFYFL